jgi:hypothetical protein
MQQDAQIRQQETTVCCPVLGEMSLEVNMPQIWYEMHEHGYAYYNDYEPCWVMTPWSLVGRNYSFEGTYCHHFQTSTLKMEAKCPSETSVTIYQI